MRRRAMTLAQGTFVATYRTAAAAAAVAVAAAAMAAVSNSSTDVSIVPDSNGTCACNWVERRPVQRDLFFCEWSE